MHVRRNVKFPLRLHNRNWSGWTVSSKKSQCKFYEHLFGGSSRGTRFDSLPGGRLFWSRLFARFLQSLLVTHTTAFQILMPLRHSLPSSHLLQRRMICCSVSVSFSSPLVSVDMNRPPVCSFSESVAEYPFCTLSWPSLFLVQFSSFTFALPWRLLCYFLEDSVLKKPHQ
jgi:hypothetical protein